jgi:dTDP-4-dehydrorhamnose 3,5-epimerase
MDIEKTPFDEAVILKPRVFQDHRGYFLESYNKKLHEKLGLKHQFVQDNESASEFATLRGLHFQTGEFAQAKLVRVIEGRVFDVIVDLREDSNTFAQWYGVELNQENKWQLLVPRGFAHGFLVLSKRAVFAYKCDNYYSPENESGVLWSDGELSIKWPDLACPYILSEKDKSLGTLKDYRRDYCSGV